MKMILLYCLSFYTMCAQAAEQTVIGCLHEVKAGDALFPQYITIYRRSYNRKTRPVVLEEAKKIETRFCSAIPIKTDYIYINPFPGAQKPEGFIALSSRQDMFSYTDEQLFAVLKREYERKKRT